MVRKHGGQYPSRLAAVVSVAETIEWSAHILNDRLKKAEVDSGQQAGVTRDMAERLKSPERESWELRQTGDILRNASAYFAQTEPDRQFKR